ncbi:MAG: YhcH/YjgK/YiaL family protein [Planctomycetes bacterium]|nr:YhcH/YjgK/YiaL family protein [Planctomycetota bacterium]
MILCRLADADPVAILHPRFAQAFAWLRACDPAIADGRYDLAGDDLYALVQSGTTRAAHEGRLESHRTYIDIQAGLGGAGETIEWAPVAGLAVEDDFQPGGDIRFHGPAPRPATRLLVMPGDIAVFWPADGHKPVCHPADAPVPFRKVVVKVRA